MGFLKKLFDRSSGGQPGAADGFFVYVQCARCGDRVRLRIHKQDDLNRTGGSYVWHKTIIDNRCFRPITTVAYFDDQFQMSSSDIDGGRYISQAEYESQETAAPQTAPPQAPE